MSKILLAALIALNTGLATAASRPFTQQEFDRLAHDGKSVVVDVAATWCPTCKAQKPIVDGLAGRAAYRDVTVLTVDFDADKAVLKEFRVGMQSTLIAFKAGRETARSVGDTTAAGIEGLFRKAVQ